jgi:quinol-cytochrome oxidoreductase complex cytochrome b subunit
VNEVSVISDHADEDPLVVPLGTDLVGNHSGGRFRRALRHIEGFARSLFGWLATAALVLLMVVMTIRAATGPRIDGHPTNTTNNYAVGAFIVLACVFVLAVLVIAACIAAPAPFVGVVWLLVVAILVFCGSVVIPLMETYTPPRR